MTRVRAILIAGPTASGKSALALGLAERLSGVVINADAMQVYRELRVLTARPSEADERRAPHVMYGSVPGGEAYSAARYAEDARSAIGAAGEAGRMPILVGGTGLYFKALLEGLSPVPPIPDEIRVRWRKAAAEAGAGAMHDILKSRDPVMAERLRPTDPQRIVRALEVLEATGVSLAHWQEMPGAPVVRLDETLAVVVSPPRDVLRQRIDTRFDAMLREGALEEVRVLLKLGLDRDLPAMRALGVRPLADLAAGRIAPEAASETAKAETRQYAKRQLTWLKRNMNAWKWIDTQQMERLEAELYHFIKS